MTVNTINSTPVLAPPQQHQSPSNSRCPLEKAITAIYQTAQTTFAIPKTKINAPVIELFKLALLSVKNLIQSLTNPPKMTTQSAKPLEKTHSVTVKEHISPSLLNLDEVTPKISEELTKQIVENILLHGGITKELQTQFNQQVKELIDTRGSNMQSYENKIEIFTLLDEKNEVLHYQQKIAQIKQLDTLIERCAMALSAERQNKPIDDGASFDQLTASHPYLFVNPHTVHEIASEIHQERSIDDPQFILENLVQLTKGYIKTQIL